MTLEFEGRTVTVGDAVVAIAPDVRVLVLKNVEDACAALADCHSAVPLPGEDEFLEIVIDGVAPDAIGDRVSARANLAYLDYPEVDFESYVNEPESPDYVEMTTIAEGVEEASINVTFVANDRIGDQAPLDPATRLSGTFRARHCFVEDLYCEPLAVASRP